MSQPHGYEEGATCNRKGCAGSIGTHPVKDCACHIAPPCGACTSARNFCPACDWQEADEEIINDYVVQIDRKTGLYTSMEPRPLDRTKIDFKITPRSNSSQTCEGVFPPGTTQAQVLEKVQGTFGGHWDRWDEARGEFKYIAYTD